MTADYLGTYEPGSDEWQALRTSGLGGSEIAAVLGLSPYESRFSLWHRKQGLADPQPDHAAMRAGRYLEPAVAAMFADAHPEWTVEQSGTWCHAERRWQIANPDRLITTDQGHRELLEIKTARDSFGWGEPGTDEIPVHYRCQILWYLDVLGLHRAHLAVLTSGQDYAEYIVEYSTDEANLLRDHGEDFLRTIEENERPSIDEHGETYQVIRDLHPDIEDASVEIPAKLAEHYRDHLVDERIVRDRKRRYVAEIADYMGTARRAYSEGQPIAIRKASHGGTPHVAPAPALTRTISQENKP
ncbi:putative phage-type endonuclease [Actinopolyspora xinjiangensis]|uniref:Putative phage-type endonuclease n=1 Tax=Actinopolyspora xinjiangensis TaxID=405564 RepID=A0A1H0U5N4_9ACTN|nr:YqaJ viral recombinase family protein [Actinopolyspora xinjiangensis]SDP61295.1 putative phage-type endonuclease [Actinopolyspora xinjiangensis]